MKELVILVGPSGWERQTIQRSLGMGHSFNVITGTSWSQITDRISPGSKPACALWMPGSQMEEKETKIPPGSNGRGGLSFLVETESASDTWLLQGLRNGACGVLAWPVSVEQLRTALMLARQDLALLTQHTSDLLLKRFRASSTGENLWGRLTARERKVATLVTRGRTNKQIASELEICVATVETHLTHIYRKLGVQSRTEAMVRLKE
jgi:DNA-binding NarL/FixJ family response regulator